MIPFEAEQPPPIPPRQSDPLSLRFRRKRNLWSRRIKNFQLEYPERLRLYAFIAVLVDFSVTSLGINAIQRLHLNDDALANEWQHMLPTIILFSLYLMPLTGVYKKLHSLLLLYVSLTLFYMFFAFLLQTRATYRSHNAHYFYRVHYCPTRYVANDSLLCIMALLKLILMWPVFRLYMYTRDLLEFEYYMRRENRNTYGLVEFEAAKVQPQQQQSKPKRYTSQPNIYIATPTTTSTGLEPSTMVIDSLVDPIYENAEIRSPHSSSLVSSEDIGLDDEVQFTYSNNNNGEDYDSSLEDIEEEEDEVLGDRITYDNRIDLEEDDDDSMGLMPGPVANPMFGIQNMSSL